MRRHEAKDPVPRVTPVASEPAGDISIGEPVKPLPGAAEPFKPTLLATLRACSETLRAQDQAARKPVEEALKTSTAACGGRFAGSTRPSAISK